MSNGENTVDVEATFSLTFVVTFSDIENADRESIADALTDILGEWLDEGNRLTKDNLTIIEQIGGTANG